MIGLRILVVLDDGYLGLDLIDGNRSIRALVALGHVAVLATAGVSSLAKLILILAVEPLEIRRLLNAVEESLEIWILLRGEELGHLLARWRLGVWRWVIERPVHDGQIDHMAARAHPRRADERARLRCRAECCGHRPGHDIIERAIDLVGGAHLVLSGDGVGEEPAEVLVFLDHAVADGAAHSVAGKGPILVVRIGGVGDVEPLPLEIGSGVPGGIGHAAVVVVLPLPHHAVAPQTGVDYLVSHQLGLVSGEFDLQLGQFALELGMEHRIPARQPHRRPPPLAVGRDI